MRLDFSRQFRENYSYTKSRGNPSSGTRVVPCGQTDRYDEANRVALRDFANAPNKEENIKFGTK